MYKVIKTTLTGENSTEYTSFGISNKEVEYPNLSVCKKEVEKLCEVCNRLLPADEHIEEIIEDFLVFGRIDF